MAPEIVNNEGYDYRVDIWSLGVLLYEMIHKKAPYPARSVHEIKVALSRTDLVFDSDVQHDIQVLIRRILEHNIEERITIDEILVHPWITYQKEKEEEFRRRAYEQEAYENKNRRLSGKMKKFTIFDKYTNPNDGQCHGDMGSVSARKNYIAPSYTKSYTLAVDNPSTRGLNSVDLNKDVQQVSRAFEVPITKYEHSFDRDRELFSNENKLSKTIIGLEYEEEEGKFQVPAPGKRGIFAGPKTTTAASSNKFYEKILSDKKWVDVTSPQKKLPPQGLQLEDETTAEGAVGDRKPLSSIPMKFLSKTHKQGLAKSNLMNFSENIKRSILASPHETKPKPRFFPEEYYSYGVNLNPLQNVSPNRNTSNNGSQIVYRL